jgi:hypothetical protein
MADTGSTQGRPEPAGLQNVQPTRMTAWVGVVAFAGAAMVVLGIFHAIQGLVAFFRDEYYEVGANELMVRVDWTTWGWVHLIGGIAIIAAGLGLFAGKVWARIVAVTLAMISAVVNIGFLAAYPIWSVLMITLDMLVIWAVMVHGDEVRA